jgi:hypothetical protein
MPSTPPTLIAIDHDDYYADRVGTTSDGRQFFVTNPFIAAKKHDAGREFLAVFLFESNGTFSEARIDDLGPRPAWNREETHHLLNKRLAELGPINYARIVVQPFAVERFGTTFGLIARAPESSSGSWWVILHPGNYMAFHEPWDSGQYDT